MVQNYELYEFWDRKVANQIEWVEKGFELEKKWSEDRKQKIAARKAKAMNLSIESESSTELESAQSEEFGEESEQTVEEEKDDDEEKEDESEGSESVGLKSDVSETETDTDQEIKEEPSRINRSAQITTVAKSRLKEVRDIYKS
ncbi:uncharacterized protein TNCV_4079751 [Trichonephila clavipes]|nr:uncharacterized protein TNCV_4079751 [Trichonephila clavipes]